MAKSFNEILLEGEGVNTEFKASFNDETILSLSAFANAKGGSVFIGVEDSGKIKGITIGKETIAKCLNEIKVKTSPSIMPDAKVHNIDGKTIIELRIQEYPIKPISFKGKYYRRNNNANHQLQTSEIAELHSQSLQKSWDAYPNPTASIEDIDLNKVSVFINKVNLGGRFILPIEAVDALTKLKMIQNNVPTNAALLLFAKESTNHNVHVGRFKTPSMILDDRMFKGDLYTLVEETMRYIISQIKVAFEIKGNTSQRTEIFE
jgi:ATP-dependent DNA helicase RecG